MLDTVVFCVCLAGTNNFQVRHPHCVFNN